MQLQATASKITMSKCKFIYLVHAGALHFTSVLMYLLTSEIIFKKFDTQNASSFFLSSRHRKMGNTVGNYYSYPTKMPNWTIQERMFEKKKKKVASCS